MPGDYSSKENQPLDREEDFGLEDFMGRSEESQEEMQQGEDLELKAERQRVRHIYMIEKTFERREDPDQRVKNWIESLGDVRKSGLVDEGQLAELLRPLASITDEKEAVEKVYAALKPFYALKTRPEVIAVHRSHKSKNRAFKYDDTIEGGTKIELHLPPTGRRDVLSLYKKGLRELAQEIKDNPNITEIFADSWIVDKNPLILEKWGFIVKEGEGYRPWSRTAVISKEDFIKEFGG